MTKQLYYTNPEIAEWSTEILEATPSDNFWKIKLKETAFYPEGGGQPCDLGTIDGIAVLKVIKEKDEIFHFIKDSPKNKTVQCKIDAARRKDFTQHHTGQHLLSAVILDLYNYETISFHLSPDTATIDLNTETLTEEELNNIEAAVNEQIYKNHQINIFEIDKKDIDKYSLRKIPPGHEKLRIVQIENIEYNACAGTHVKQTGQIGQMKLLKTEKNRDSVRLFFVCGQRLLKDYSEKLTTVNNVALKISTSPQNVEEHVEKIMNNSKETLRAFNELVENYVDLIAEKLVKEQANQSIHTGIFDNLSVKELNLLKSKLISTNNKIIVLASEKDNRLLLSHDGSLDFHCGNLIKEHVGEYFGKGGGSPKDAQASFSSNVALKNFYEFMISNLNN